MKILFVLSLMSQISFAAVSEPPELKSAKVTCNDFVGRQVVSLDVSYYQFMEFNSEISDYEKYTPTVSNITIQNAGQRFDNVQPWKVLLVETGSFDGLSSYDLKIRMPELVKIYSGGKWWLALRNFYVGTEIGAQENEEEGGYLAATFSTGSDEVKLLCLVKL